MLDLVPLSNQIVTDFLNRIFKVAIYIRLSREDGDKDESSSVTNQRQILTRFIQANENFILVKEYVDDGYTGTNFNRPAFKEMIEDIEKGKIDTVITKDLSRLGRDYIDTGYYLQRYFPEKRVRYIALLDNIDTLQDAGMNDIAPFKSVINDMYVKDISSKVKSALRERKKAGNFLGTTTPYGYKKSENNKYQLVINEEEAKVVRHIFDLYLQGNGLTKIAQILTKEEIPVPGIARDIRTNSKSELYYCWKQGTISRILRNVVYTGCLEQFKREKINYKSKVRVAVPKEKRVICENTHEPIISKEKFEEVQNLLKNNSSFKKGTKHDYLFKGLLFCEECGAKLYLTYSNYALKKYGEYRYTTVCYTYSQLYNKCTRHSNSIPLLEKLLIEHIKKVCCLYVNKDLKEELIELAEREKDDRESINNYNNKLLEIDNKIEEINSCIKNLYIDKVKQVITEENYVELSKSFEEDKKKLLKEKEKYTILVSEKNSKKDNRNKIKKLATQFVSMEKPTKEVLNQLIEKITISEENEITIYFKFKELNNIGKGTKLPECKTINKRNNKKAS